LQIRHRARAKLVANRRRLGLVVLVRVLRHSRAEPVQATLDHIEPAIARDRVTIDEAIQPFRAPDSLRAEARTSVDEPRARSYFFDFARAGFFFAFFAAFFAGDAFFFGAGFGLADCRRSICLRRSSSSALCSSV
jgi:hypothetical protein